MMIWQVGLMSEWKQETGEWVLMIEISGERARDH